MSSAVATVVRGAVVELRRFRWLALLLGVYVALRVGFTLVSEEHGLIAPSGAPNVGVMALGLALLVARLSVLVAMPAWFAFRAATLLLRAIHPGTPRRGS